MNLSGLSQRQSFMLCVWLDHHGIIYFDFFFFLIAVSYTMQTYNQCISAWKSLKKHSTIVNRRNVELLHVNSNHIQQKSHRKILDWSRVVLSHTLYSPDHHHVILIFFVLKKCSEWQKKYFQKDQVKTFVENFLILKPYESYMRRIN